MQKEKRAFDNPNILQNEDFKNIVTLGLYTPSQSIATGELRNDSLQNIIGILAHAKYPASKEELINCAQKRNAEREVIEIIKKLPTQHYDELSIVIKAIIDEKLK